MKHLSLPNNASDFDAVVLANGAYPTRGLALSLLHSAERVVCCDGAVNHFVACGGEPFAIVGDLDSLCSSLAEKYADRVHEVHDQDYNDLTKSVRFCIAQGFKKIAILGATGLRDDHSIANVGLLEEYYTLLSVVMITDYGVFDMIDAPTSFESYASQQVSLFLLDRGAEIAVEGLQYSPPDNHLKGWWQGSLNAAVGESFTIRVNTPTLVFRNLRNTADGL